MPSRLLVLLAALPLLCLAGCGSDDDSTASDSASDSASSTPSTSASTSASTTSTSAPAVTSTSASSAAGGSGATCSYPKDTTGTAARQVDAPPATPDVSGTVTAAVDTSVGKMTFSLDAAAAPCTVNSFVSLAKQGYFDKTTCHRLTVVTGFEVLQCGDPTGTGYGGPGYTIPDEFTGQETYPAGTLAMANTGQPNSGGSQFFIVYGDTQLPPAYTVFGTVDQATIDDIKQVEKAGVDNANGQGDGKPNTPVDISSVTIG